ncbi:hypothetical protein DY000_02055361 [Brassica cretica]|uniref:RNase H type-1 domain-containing protein n=1 Tax=Brassica cretica TaxID=69181 RepID=A0ABQ7AKQ1_BRACR|nr:hypothetical protein DY000_02055361 [Brassica cretica]
MTSLNLDKLIMAGELEELFGAVLKPHLWPAFGFQRQEIMASMVGIRHWKVQVTRKEANRGAGFIAESVNKFNFGQSPAPNRLRRVVSSASFPAWRIVLVVDAVTFPTFVTVASVAATLSGV